MTHIVTIIRYQDHPPHPFVHPAEERIRELLNGAINHYPTRGILPHALVIDGTRLAIDEEISLSDKALREKLLTNDLRLIETHEIGDPGPHHYTLDHQNLGDCRICGRLASDTMHRMPGPPA